MSDDALRATVLQVLGMADATEEEQDTALYYVESIAVQRFSLAIPELLSDAQLGYIEQMRSAGSSEAEIVQRVDEWLPQQDDIIRAIILDVAEEVANNL